MGQAPAGTTNVPSSGISTNTIGNGGLGDGSVPVLPTVTIAAVTTPAAEGGAIGSFTISRTGATTNALTVNFTLGGGATAGIDYQIIGTSVVIPAGAAATVLVITPIDDAMSENNETAVLNLASSTNYAVRAPSAAAVTINDNDSQLPATLVVSIRPNNGMLTVAWNSIPGRIYQVGFKNNLNNTTWTPLGPPITAIGTTASYSDNPPVGSLMRYYNVQLQ